MTVLILLTLLAVSAGLVLVAPVLYRLLKPCDAEEITPEWLDQFSPHQYYPMEALLAKEDFRFLARQPGFDLSLHRKLRRERMIIFRQYLRRLISDFNRLHKLARMLVASSSADNSHIVPKLFALRVRFTVSVLHAESSYMLCQAGFHSLTIHRAIATLEEMSKELTGLGATLPSNASA